MQVVVKKFSYGVQKIVYVITHVFSLLLFSLLTIESVKYGNALKLSGQVSNTLQIPFYPVLYGIAFSSFVVILVITIDLVLVITGKEKAWYGWPQ